MKKYFNPNSAPSHAKTILAFSRRNQKAFTLIELLVVIAVIGLLASVVLVALATTRIKSRDAKRLADVKQIADAMALYFSDCNSYPIVTAATIIDNTKTLQEGTAANCGNNQAGGAVNGGIGSSGGTVVANQLPLTPTPADGTCTTANNVYTYTSYKDSANVTASIAADTVASGYKVTFCLGAQTGGSTLGVHTLTPTGVQ